MSRRVLAGLVLGLVMGMIAEATRLPALLYPRAIDDEAVYGVVARVMLAGGLPYHDAMGPDASELMMEFFTSVVEPRETAAAHAA